jgi:hypothetical protein
MAGAVLSTEKVLAEMASTEKVAAEAAS